MQWFQFFSFRFLKKFSGQFFFFGKILYNYWNLNFQNFFFEFFFQQNQPQNHQRIQHQQQQHMSDDSMSMSMNGGGGDYDLSHSSMNGETPKRCACTCPNCQQNNRQWVFENSKKWWKLGNLGVKIGRIGWKFIKLRFGKIFF